MGIKVGEGYVFFLGILIRIALSYLAKPDFLKSLTHSVTDGWEIVLEGKAFKSAGISPYLSDASYQAPLVLQGFIWVHSFFTNHPILIFLTMDFVMVHTLVQLVKAAENYFLSQQTSKSFTVCEQSKPLLLRSEDLNKVQCYVMVVYSLNPLLILSFHAMNITTLYAILIVKMIVFMLQGRNLGAMTLCAFLAYCQPYYVALVVPLVANIVNTRKQLHKPLMTYALVLISVLLISGFLEGGFAFLGNVYLNPLTFTDGTPHLNMFWYFFNEMFDHFRGLFIATIHICSATCCLVLAIKERHDPLFLVYCTWFFLAVVKPYPSIGEVGTLLALLPVWSHLYSKGTGQYNAIPYALLLAVMCLAPLMHYLWLYAGSANANFYFAISLLYSLTQTLLLGGLFRMHSLRDMELRWGVKPKLSDGTALVNTFE